MYNQMRYKDEEMNEYKFYASVDRRKGDECREINIR